MNVVAGLEIDFDGFAFFDWDEVGACEDGSVVGLFVPVGGWMVLDLGALDFACQAGVYHWMTGTFFEIGPFDDNGRRVRLLHHIV